MQHSWRLVAFVVVASSLAACGSDGESSTTETASSVAAIEVTFDGVTCGSNGPSTVAAGEHSFLLIDRSDRPRTEMWVAYLAEGHTYEELLELQDEAGGPGSDGVRPAFVMSTAMVAPPSSPADGQTLYLHELEPGAHAFVVGGSDAQWICGSFEVTPA